jgi:hypothetical protein
MTTLLHNSVADVTYILHVYSINYWISTIAKIPSTEQDGVFNIMSMGRNWSSLAWMTTEEIGLVWP